MNNKITHRFPQTAPLFRLREGLPKPLFMLVLSLVTLAATGCFRATGIQRTPMAAEVMPETGGDRVLGLKTKAGAGDYYLGNDFIQVAIDSTVYQDQLQAPLAGAASGGSIVDAGYLLLDNSYNRVSIPGNAMNRLTQVVNQDPNLQMVVDQFQPVNTGALSSITMTGRLLDPNHTLGGTSPVTGVSVVHTISVAQLDHFFTLTTTVTNNSQAPIAIQSVGDSLVQQGGGYHFNIPANFDYQGNALTTPWGVQIPSYTDFAHPLTTSVQAPMVGLMNSEPGATMLDSHASLGILPVDADQLLVASDPQDLLDVAGQLRPAVIPGQVPSPVPAQLVAGSLPTGTALAPGASLTYHRRLYIYGGQSISSIYPNQATGLFNAMDTDRYTDTNLHSALRLTDTGTLNFTLAGSSVRQGPLPTEIRIERNMNATTLPAPANSTWQVQRVEWFEPNENIVTQTALAPSTLQVILPVGIYRMVLTNRIGSTTYTQTRTSFENTNDIYRVQLSEPLWIQKDQTFIVSANDVLCPDAAPDTDNPNLVGTISTNHFSAHYFQTREANSPVGNIQPLRITIVGPSAADDPLMRRQRTLASYFDATNDEPFIASGGIQGQYQFRAGNEMFGTGFSRYAPSEYVWLPNNSTFIAYGSRGPLSELESLNLTTYDGQTDNSHVFTVFPMGLPPGWTSFDMPGPSQATTGGYLPGEKLASAMANGIQVVGDTEQDQEVDGTALYNDFTAEFRAGELSNAQRPASLSAVNRPVSMPCGYEPFVVGSRTSTLPGYGTVSALFAPAATNARLGGAIATGSGWLLADFLAQAQGQFNVIHRPRGPQGLFTLQTPGATPLITSSWWGQSGLMSFGKVNGNFDALELLRGESLDPADPSAWFAEFLQVRNDWFALLNQQSPDFFTKALGLSSGLYSIDTPVGLARTYLKASPTGQTDLSGVLTALQSGAAVASTGPFLDVSVGAAGPGGSVTGPVSHVNLAINLWKTDWMPVDELRVVVNGTVVQTYNSTSTPTLATLLAQSGADTRLYTGTVGVDLTGPAVTSGKDAWIVVEAGVPLSSPASGLLSSPLYAPWTLTMRGIYPIAVTNPIFVNVTGGSYKPPVS